MIEVKELSKNLIRKYHGKVNSEVLRNVIHQLNCIVPYKMSAQELLFRLRHLIDRSNNIETKKLFADCYVYVEYISDIAIERLLKCIINIKKV